MTSWYFPQTRTERLIAIGRALLAVSSLITLWLDPTEPARYGEVAYALLVTYLVYSLVVAGRVVRANVVPSRLGILTHGVDLAFFTVIQYFTESPTNPFFLYFLFSLLCAMLRWQWRGVLWTAPIALSAYVGLGVFATYVLGDYDFAPGRFGIRSVYLAIMALLLGCLGAYESYRRGELADVAAWRDPVDDDASAWFARLLGHVAQILGAPRALLAWEEPGDPGVRLAWWSHGEFSSGYEGPDTFGSLVAEPLAGSDFVCVDAAAATPVVAYVSAEGLRTWRGAPIDPGLSARFAIRSVLCFALGGESLRGRLFVLDKPRPTSDDLQPGRLVARRVAANLERLHQWRRRQDAVAVEERARLACDLHDGVLQTLAGTVFELEVLRRQLPEDSVIRERLLEIQMLAVAQQRELRALVEPLKGAALAPPVDAATLAARCRELGRRIERQWEQRVEVFAERWTGSVPAGTARQIYHLVNEALVNAARHAGASALVVELAAENGTAQIRVTDNGGGFPFHGQYDLKALEAMGLGPVTLRHRLRMLGGDLIIDSTPGGSRLAMALPIPGDRDGD